MKDIALRLGIAEDGEINVLLIKVGGVGF